MLRDAARDAWREADAAALIAAVLALPTLGPLPAFALFCAAVVMQPSEEVPEYLQRPLWCLFAFLVAPVAWLLSEPGELLAEVSHAIPVPRLPGLVGVLAFVAALLAVVALTHERRRRSRVIGRVREALAPALGLDEVRDVKVRRVRWARLEDEEAPPRAVVSSLKVTAPRRFEGSSQARQERVKAALVDQLRAEADGGLYRVQWAAKGRCWNVHREAQLPAYVEWKPLTFGGRPSPYPLVAVTAKKEAHAIADDGTPVLRWDWTQDVHMLLVGPTGAGKSVTAAGIIRSALDIPGLGSVDIIDGKREGDFLWLSRVSPLVRHNAVDDEAFVEALREIAAEAAAVHAAVLAWQRGDGPAVTVKPRLVVIDEYEQVMRAEGAPELIEELAKTARSAGVHLLMVTQRPDASKDFPARVRDQLTARAVLGEMSGGGWRMVLDDRWKRGAELAAGDQPDEDDPPAHPGRVVALLARRVRAGQAPDIPNPIKSGDWRAVPGGDPRARRAEVPAKKPTPPRRPIVWGADGTASRPPLRPRPAPAAEVIPFPAPTPPRGVPEGLREMTPEEAAEHRRRTGQLADDPFPLPWVPARPAMRRPQASEQAREELRAMLRASQRPQGPQEPRTRVEAPTPVPEATPAEIAPQRPAQKPTPPQASPAPELTPAERLAAAKARQQKRAARPRPTAYRRPTT